jgi:hypothetical protein
LGHWSIYEVDDGTHPLDEIWGDQEADRLDEYLEYLSSYEPARLNDREGLLEDLGVMVWDVLYELEEGRKATRDELEYGLDFSCAVPATGKPNTEPTDESSTIPELQSSEHVRYLPEYFKYLEETDSVRLQNRTTLLNDVRVLTWEVFKDLRNRPARQEELEYLLDYALSEA